MSISVCGLTVLLITFHTRSIELKNVMGKVDLSVDMDISLARTISEDSVA